MAQELPPSEYFPKKTPGPWHTLLGFLIFLGLLALITLGVAVLWKWVGVI